MAPSQASVQKAVDALQAHKDLMLVVQGDLNAAQTPLTSPPYTATAGRAYIRAAFAFIEADLFVRKQTALLMREIGVANLTGNEVAAIHEERYEITEAGRVKIFKRFPALVNNIRFSFRVYSKAFHLKYDLDTSDDGWQKLLDAIKTRHRITHPKSAEDLEITEDELKRIMEGCIWYHKASNEALDEATNRMREATESVLRQDRESKALHD